MILYILEHSTTLYCTQNLIISCHISEYGGSSQLRTVRVIPDYCKY